MYRVLALLAVLPQLAFAACDESLHALPQPGQLAAQWQLVSTDITVAEPHAAHGSEYPEVRYRAYPAEKVLDALLCSGWRKQQADIEFRALDGYVSRIEVARFARYRAWLAFARADGQAFSVDNHTQNEQAVPLGPYYLVWDNLAAPELLQQGGSGWPYQISQLGLSYAGQRVLLPGRLARTQVKAAHFTRQHCLACHQINGYGGDKLPINLAQVVKGWKAADFERWVLAPSRVKPGTAMPALPPLASPAERRRVARAIYGYLQAVPVAP